MANSADPDQLVKKSVLQNDKNGKQFNLGLQWLLRGRSRRISEGVFDLIILPY